MPSIRRCPTCKVIYPTINALNDHCNLTSHKPLPYKCEPCEQAFKTLSSLQSHIKDSPRHFKDNGKRAVIAQMDSGGWNAEEDDDDSMIEVDSNYGDVHKEWLAECDAYSWGSLGNFSERGPLLVEKKKRPSAASNNISGPPPSVSKLTLPPTSSSSKDLRTSAGASLSKLDKATAKARAALYSRFHASKLDEDTDPLRSDICHTRKGEPSASKLDHGSSSIAIKSSSNNTTKSKLPLNSPDNTTYPFICPGCRKGFKLFSGFVLHIENRACKSSMCPEIEDRIYTCAAQFFGTFTS